MLFFQICSKKLFEVLTELDFSRLFFSTSGASLRCGQYWGGEVRLDFLLDGRTEDLGVHADVGDVRPRHLGGSLGRHHDLQRGKEFNRCDSRDSND